jgi:hypothetical protein
MKHTVTTAQLTFRFLALFFCQVSSIYALECKSIEYAELIQLNGSELKSKYCDYNNTFDLSLKTSLSALKAADEMKSVGNGHGIVQLMENNKENLKESLNNVLISSSRTSI